MLVNLLVILTAVLLIVLFVFNSSKEFRYKQWVHVLFASFFFLTYMTLYLHVMDIVVWLKLGDFFDDTKVYIANSLREVLGNDKYEEYFSFSNSIEHIALYITATLLVVFYVFLKIILRFVSFFKNIVSKTSIIPLISKLFYEYDNEVITVKDQWVFVGKLSKVLGSVFFLLSLVYLYQSDLGIIWPIYLAIASLFLLEIGFYLDGIKNNLKRFSLSEEETSSSTKVKLDILYDAYKEKFQDKLLADTKKTINRSHHKFTYNVESPYLKYIYDKFEDNNNDICNKYFEGIDLLITGKKQNILFSNSYDEEYGFYLQVMFDYAYLHNKQILILVLDETEKEKTISWVKKLIEEEVYQVEDCLEFKYEERSYHILVETIKQVLHDDKLIDHYNKFEYAVILDLKNFMRRNHLYLNTFLNEYRSKVNKFPKIIGFSNVPNAIETGFHAIFLGDKEDTEEIKIPHTKTENFYALVFKEEGGMRFQDYLQINKGQFIGNEVPLGYFAWNQGGIKPITISSDKSSISEELEALENTTIDSTFIKTDIQVLNNRFFNNITKKNKLFIVDDMSNLAQTLSKWSNYTVGKDNFLVVVSSNYLFRDYFTNNLEFLYKSNEHSSGWFEELFPQGTRNKKEDAFLLLARLSSTEVLREDIVIGKNILINKRNIAEYINKHSGLHIEPSLISSKEKRIFRRDGVNHQPDFVKKIYYSIPSKRYFPETYYYTIVNANNTVLGICLEDDVYHKYLTNMDIILHDKVYKILDINRTNKILQVLFQDTIKIKHFDIDKVISVIKEYPSSTYPINKTVLGIEIIASIVNIDYECNIKSYREAFVDSTVFNVSEDDKVKLEYKKKETLLLHFKTQRLIGDSMRVGFEFILQGLFRSLFPHTYHLLNVKVVTKNINESFIFTDNHRGFDDKELKVYIFETGHLNYNLLSTIINNYDRILMLIQDFIRWNEENNITIGLPSENEQNKMMDFTSLNEFISLLLENHNEITAYRKDTVEIISETLDSGHQCDYCGERLSLQFHEIDDGREQCDLCHKSSVEYLGISYKNLVDDSIKYLEETYSIKIDQDLAVEIVKPKTLAKELGITFEPTSGYDHRAVGLAISGETKRILIEDAAPVFRAMGVIVHELTHIWQFQNLDFSKMNDDLVKIEGHAKWVQLTFVEEKYPNQKEYVEMEKKRNDEYGNGYRYVEQVLENRGSGLTQDMFNGTTKNNPFDAYLDMFGKNIK